MFLSLLRLVRIIQPYHYRTREGRMKKIWYKLRNFIKTMIESAVETYENRDTSDEFDDTEPFVKQVPTVYFAFFSSAIVLFSLMYYFFPVELVDSDKIQITSYWECLYFSVVTITTLGYGDISPANGWAMSLTAAQSIIGIGIIGLFLNALSHQHSSDAQKIERFKLEEHFNNIITGGNSCPRVMLQLKDNEINFRNSQILCDGEHTLFDLKLTIISQSERGSKVIDIGTLTPLVGRTLGVDIMLDEKEEQTISFLFQARNGHFNQTVKIKRKQDRWEMVDDTTYATKMINGEAETFMVRGHNRYRE